MQRTTFTDTNAMTDEEIDSFLSAPRVARMGTVRSDGSVHLTPVWYLWKDRLIYLVMGAERLHVRNSRRDPRTTICIDADPRLEHGFEAGAQGVTMRCIAEYTTDPALMATIYEEIAEMYGLAGNQAYITARDAEPRVIGILRPERIQSWDFSKG